MSATDRLRQAAREFDVDLDEPDAADLLAIQDDHPIEVASGIDELMCGCWKWWEMDEDGTYLEHLIAEAKKKASG